MAVPVRTTEPKHDVNKSVATSIAFRKSTCYIRDLKGNDLLTGSHGTDLYSITLQDSTTPNPICLMAKATSSQAWLWHRRLSHLNFDTINLLSKNNIVNGLPKLKFIKDHLCSSCELGKAKRKSFHTKTTPSSKRRLQLLHMDLCGPMRVESIKLKEYVLVFVMTSPDILGLTSCGPKTKHLELSLISSLLSKEDFMLKHETSTARTPEQNGVVERRNRTLVEAARTMLSAAKVPLFFWAEAIATAFKFFHLLVSSLPHRDGENLDKMKEKGDACIFVGYSTQSKAYQEVYVNQTNGFVDPYHPDKVYRLKKALYGLKQAPRAWYDELSNFLDTSCDSIGTPMATKHLDADLSGTPVDQTKYRSMVGALMYLTASRPDIVHATCYCARYQAKPTEKHLTAVKWIFRYLKDSINMGLWYPKDTGFELTAFQIRNARRAVLDSLRAHLWHTISRCHIHLVHSSPAWPYKHFDVRYHFIKEQVKKGIVELFFVRTEYQLADLFTKALSEDRFKSLVRQLGMRCLTPDELEDDLEIEWYKRFIADNIAKDICFFVLSSEKQVSPRSNCSCKELQSNAEVLEKQQMLAKSEHQSSLIQKQFVDLQLKFQNYKERLRNEKVCVPPNATASNAIFEINQLKYQLQRKDDTIRNLETHINITRMLNVGPTTGSLDQQALETEVTQLKDALTSLRIQNDGYKIENANVNRRYLELSTASTHSRTTLTGKMAILNAEIAKLKAEAVGKKNSGPTELVKPKVLASMMYTKSSKYIVPPKRANWVQPTPLPKKKQVTFQDPHRSSPRPAQKPQVQQHKKPTVPVNVFQKPKPATVARKPNPKNNFRNHSRLPTKNVKARRAADYYRNLYVDIGQFVVHSTKFVHVKTHEAKCAVNTSKNAWKATKEDVARIVPQWKPTGKRFNLCDIYGPRMSTDAIVKPLELTPCVSSSSSSTVTMVSRFFDYRLGDRKAGSKGISGIFEC
ncbi:putative reverse transcriptase domain-containing protein [Tanacetum coccineum]